MQEEAKQNTATASSTSTTSSPSGPEEKPKSPTPQFIEDVKKLQTHVVKVSPFNTDVFTPVKLGDTQEEIEKDNQYVKSLALLLKDTIVPNFVC